MKSIPLFQLRPKWQDAVAGITVGIVSLPQAMAFSLLAGMPPIYGLYGAFIPLLIYAFFGTSSFLNVGPVSVVSIFIFSLISPHHAPFSEDYINAVILLGLLVGVFQMIAGFLGAGKYISFLPKSVISGFVQAAAVVIIISQLGVGFGLELNTGSSIQQDLILFLNHLQKAHFISSSLFIGSLLILFLGKHYFQQFPTTIGLLFLSGMAAYLLDWEDLGILLIGEVPQGLPTFYLPTFSQTMIKLIPGAIGLTFISTIGSYVMAKTLEDNQRTPYKADQDFIALGLSKIIASFFGALISAGSFNRSILNHKVGASSQYASVFSALVVALTLLFLTPTVYYLPQPVIAAIIVYSAFFLFDLPLIVEYWKNDRRQFIYFGTTLTLTLSVGFIEGIFIGMLMVLVSKTIKK